MNENKPSLQELGRSVAQNMGFEWHYIPPQDEDYGRNRAEIGGPGGCSVVITGDGYNWEQSDRVEVYGTWPKSLDRRDGNRVDFMPYRDNRPDNITCAISRGSVSIARDILRRYVPAYLPAYEKQVEYRQEYLQKEAAVNAAYEELAEAMGEPPSNNGSHRLRYSDDQPFGDITISAYKGISARFDIHNVPMDKALQIARILAA